ncbi:hypothetical protein LJR098_002130 [Rhizobium sp. LjRoot98]|uniref:hypothetical protein n=1 Tax=unclassified Rhizobium TaxID=2613769 RepID=UPI000712CF29|nr:hypothetical protein [Rhizobium sp. Root1204]KQV30745.1 hypothetical protein ASC96_31275 [Rhizobium sp. Root1204]
MRRLQNDPRLQAIAGAVVIGVSLWALSRSAADDHTSAIDEELDDESTARACGVAKSITTDGTALFRSLAAQCVRGQRPYVQFLQQRLTAYRSS